ncbi:hypothetical protein M3Y94_01189000 [Aphelenchoides besseyi]|nr:hypothetical protein M3Y94_01189000 [Aphelenchoides besseyi]
MATMLKSINGILAESSVKEDRKRSVSSQPSNLSSQREGSQETDESDNDDSGAASGSTHSRKEKSLGILCGRFLDTMGQSIRNGSDIHLETVAKEMSTEKRRIYDIVNVMEALEAMSKTNKSYYRWNTLAALPQLMYNLKKEAEMNDLPRRIKNVEGAMCSFTELGAGSREAVGSVMDESNGSLTDSSVDGRCTSELRRTKSNLTASSLRDRNGKNSLAQLCRRFLMVLLCNPDDKRKVSLDVASTVLIKEPESEGYDPPSRSRCRRLYDIANVLVAMKLIKKVHYLFGTKKIPLFLYCGPEPSETREEALHSMTEFVERSQLAKPIDATWIAIFGNVPQANSSTVFRSLHTNTIRPNLRSDDHQPKSSIAHLPSPLFSKQPVESSKLPSQRRVLGELNQIKSPRSVSGINSNLQSSFAIPQLGKQPIKRKHDGVVKMPSNESINNVNSLSTEQPEAENDENALPKPKPRVGHTSSNYENQLTSEYEPANKRPAQSTTNTSFDPQSQSQLLSQFSYLSSCFPNISPLFNYNSSNNALNYFATAVQIENIRQLLGEQQQQQSTTSSAQNLFDIKSTAFKPFHSSGSQNRFRIL